MTSRHRFLAIASMMGALTGCRAEHIGPKPQVEALSPSLVCSEQGTTEVVIAGDELSPLAIDVATEDPKLAISDVSLRRTSDLEGQAVEGKPVVLPNNPSRPDDARVRWHSTTRMSFDVYPELALEPGLYEVTVTNRNGRSVTIAAAMTAVARPEVTAVEADLVCVEQGARGITVRGHGFVVVGTQKPLLQAAGATLEIEWLHDCIDLPGPTEARQCETIVAVVPPGSLAPGAAELVVTNPDPAGCVSTDVLTLAVVPPPSVEAVEPDLVCVAQGERALTVSGEGFVRVGDDLPQVRIGTETFVAGALDECEAIPGTLLPARACRTLSLRVPAAAVPAGAHAVTVTNPDPAGCSSEEALTVAVTPPPSVDGLVHDLVCLAQGGRSLTLNGSGFVMVGAEAPVVTIGEKTFASEPSGDCQPVEGTTLDALSCTSLVVNLPEHALDAADSPLAVSVTNPAPAGCTSEEEVKLAVIPPPQLAAVAPDLFCPRDGGETLTLSGSGFLRVGADSLPKVAFGEVLVTASDAAACEDVPGTLVEGTQRCTELTVVVPAGTVLPGPHEVLVTNPDPAGCTSETPVGVLVAGAPVIAEISPDSVCSTNQPSQLVIEGAGFLVISGQQPAVSVDGQPVDAIASDCLSLEGSSLAALSCSTITLDMPEQGFGAGAHAVSVTNPHPAACSAPVSGTFEIASAPTIASVVPSRICAEASTFRVHGTSFASASRLQLSTSVAPEPVDVDTSFVSATELQGHLDGSLRGGLYNVTVWNGEGCAATELDALRLVNAPTVFFADPPSVYNGVNFQATLYASGINPPVRSVAIRPTGTDEPALPLTFDASQPRRIRVNLPEGLPEGAYDVEVEDELCAAVLTGGMKVTGDLTVAVEAIQPGFGYTGERTAVEITSPVPAPEGMTSFVRTPRVYLNPRTEGSFASELRSVSFMGEGLLTAVIPDGLDAGYYDLVVINPDGGVGFLESAYQVLAEPTPAVTELLPALATNQSGREITVFGENFRAPLTVTASCYAPDGTARTPVTASSATVAQGGTSIATSWNFSALQGNEFCILRVTHDDGIFGEFSSLTITNPSGNLNTFRPGTDMVHGRRAAAAAAVRLNAVSRLVYAIGGDAGPTTDAHPTVESTLVDAMGRMGEWTVQRNDLPEGRSFISAAAVGRHIYVAAGREDGVASNSVLRAYLLDPFEAVEISDVDLTRGTGSGLDGGLWYYRVAAVRNAQDPNNPDGEDLASEPLLVQVPSREEKIHLTLAWDSIPGAKAYRIYRTPETDGLADDVRLLAEVEATAGQIQEFTDLGDLMPVDEPPLPLGSLGVWHPAGTLAEAREGAALVAVRDPAQPNHHHLYVVGGRDGATALTSYEWARITAMDSSRQTVTPFSSSTTEGLEGLSTGRWQIGAVSIDGTRATVLQGTAEAWIYVLPGKSASGSTVGQVTAFRLGAVRPDGTRALENRVALSSPNTGFAGYGYAAGANYVHMFGAQTGAPSNSGQKAEVCTSSGGTCNGATVPPNLDNWSSGTNLHRPRHLTANAAQSGFVFLLGGQADAPAEAATRSTERTNF